MTEQPELFPKTPKQWLAEMRAVLAVIAEKHKEGQR